MVEPSRSVTNTIDADHSLDDLLAEISEKLGAGQSVDIELYTKRYPEQAEQLRRVLPAMQALAESMDGLGQALFQPPNVKGWDGGKTWLNSATLVARHNLAARLIGGRHPQFRNRVRPAHARPRNIRPGSWSQPRTLPKRDARLRFDIICRRRLGNDYAHLK